MRLHQSVGTRGPRPYVIETKRGSFEADVVLANLTPWALAKLMGDDAPSGLRQRVKNLKPISSAFMAYLGVDEAAIEGDVDHHQVIVDPVQPLGEGNSIFVSISPEWDRSRAPQGQRAITISTHTHAANWYAQAKDEAAFEDRKQLYLERLIDAATIALPKLKQHIKLAMPGTPLTFERFTHRVNGVVGGFPQKSLWPDGRHGSIGRCGWWATASFRGSPPLGSRSAHCVSSARSNRQCRFVIDGKPSGVSGQLAKRYSDVQISARA